MAGGRPTKYDPKYCEMLIAHMKQGLSYECFAAVVETHKQTLYNWEKQFPEFFDAKKTGVAQCNLFWEKMGIHGAAGKLAGFNASSWIFNMKNRFRWTDRQETVETSKIEISINNEDERL